MRPWHLLQWGADLLCLAERHLLCSPVLVARVMMRHGWILQQDVKLAEPPECAWVCQSLNNKARNSRNPNYRPRLTEHGRKLVWLALRNSIHGGDDANDPANSALAPARRTPATAASLGVSSRIPAGVLDPICAK